MVEKSMNEINMNNVEHPNHYSGKYECIELMRALYGDKAVKYFCICNSFKYRFRASRKNGDEDIAKAEWYEDYLMTHWGADNEVLF